MTEPNRTLAEVRADLLANDPELRGAYEESRPAFLVARELIRARNRLGLTQAQVAERTGKPASVISRLESMDTTPTLRTANELASALGLVLELRFVDPTEGAAEDAGAELPHLDARLEELHRAISVDLEGFDVQIEMMLHAMVERLANRELADELGRRLLEDRKARVSVPPSRRAEAEGA